jgi:DNA-binding beta-propeller fold protein YncE
MLDRRQFLALGLAAAPALLARPAWGAADAGPLALVTADTEAHVAVVALARMRVVARLATVEDPRSIQSGPGGRVVVVAHAGAGAVSLLAGRPPRVRRVLRGFGAPRYAAIRSEGRLAYVSDSAHGEIAVVDLVAGRVLRRVPVGDGARHLALHPDGRSLWVALGSSAAQIAVVDVREPAHPRLHGHVRPPFLAHDVGFSSGRRAWVTAGREPRIALVDTATRRPARLLRADAAPQHVSFGGGLAYVASGVAGTVAVHALDDATVRRRTRVPVGSYNVQRTGPRVVTPSLGGGRLTVLDRHGRVTGEVHVAAAAHDACIVS